MSYEIHEATNEDLQCKYCGSTDCVKAGVRQLKASARQVWLCNTCLRRFSNRNRTGKHTPPEAILKALALACQGYPYRDITVFLERRFGVRVTHAAVAKWVKEYQPPYLAVRDRNLPVERVIRGHVFTHHDLRYHYQLHIPKLQRAPWPGLVSFLTELPGRIQAISFEEAARCSQLTLAVNPGLYHSTHTPLNRTVLDALTLSPGNRARHQTLEDYLLACDLNTIAVEVPVWYDDPRIGPVAGHIDILQVHRDRIYILDFKPAAAKETPEKVITQLTLYAAALVQRARIPWSILRCAYFDEQDYYSFRPEARLFGPPEPNQRAAPAEAVYA